MKEISGEISLRPVSPADKEMIFEWRNTPFLVKLGSTQKTVTREEHYRWFDSVLLNDKTMVLFIINVGGIPVGQVRFDFIEGNIYRVSIYLLEEYTGRGIGTDALQKGIELIRRDDANRKFIAFIKRDNKASRAIFLKTGFKKIENSLNVPDKHIAMINTPVR